jgi:hypothetical protein
MLRPEGGWMSEVEEGSMDVPGHGDVDVSFVVVPVEGQTAIECAGPVDGQGIIFLEGVYQVIGVGFGEIFNSKVVDAEDEGGSFCLVAPESWGERHRGVAVGCEVLDEEVEGDDAGFFQAVHSFSDFQVDETIGGDVDIIVGVVPDFLGDDGRGDADILVVIHGGSQVLIFDVEAEVACSMLGVGDGAVEMDLGVQLGDGR